MKDPVRWRQDCGADAEMRALLTGGDGEGPCKNERERIWAGLVPHIQMLPAPPPVTPPALFSATGAGALLGKITLGVVLVGAVGTGVHVARSRTGPVPPASVRIPPAPEIPKPDVPTLAPVAPAAPVPVAKPATHRPRSHVSTPASAKTIEAPPAPAMAPAPVVVSNELLEEGRRLSRARAALRAHDPEGALVLLQSGPVSSVGLSQEREALTIEALWLRPSSRAEATQRAHRFMTAYPDSPYRARLKALTLEDR